METNRQLIAASEKTAEHLANLPFYHDLPRATQKMLYNEIFDSFLKEDFCESHNINDKQYTENGSSVFYCGQVIEFPDKVGADNFIEDMYELSACGLF